MSSRRHVGWDEEEEERKQAPCSSTTATEDTALQEGGRESLQHAFVQSGGGDEDPSDHFELARRGKLVDRQMVSNRGWGWL